MSPDDAPTADFEPLPGHAGGGGGVPPGRAVTSSADDPGPPGYEIIRLLATDGLCRTYLAREVALAKLVVLKLLPAGGPGGAYARERFLAATRTVATLQHPGIVPVYEVGEYPGGVFVVMKYVDGVSLAEVLAASPLKPRAVAEVAAALAGTVEYAHQQGVVHRDLKPANVLVGGFGEVYLTDFGLALLPDDVTDEPMAGPVVGTPAYMAPEQARGETHRIGPAADVWGLGAVLYACLTGRPPFHAGTVVDLLVQVVTAAPDPPRSLAPDVHPDLELVCLKCLEKDPARRYGSAAELADDLGRFLAGEPVAARPASWWGRVWKRAAGPARVTVRRPPPPR